MEKATYPVVAREVMASNSRTKRSSRVERTTRVEDTSKLSNKQSETNSQRSHECDLCLLCSEHEDGEDEDEGKEHFDEDTLGDAGAIGKRGVDLTDIAREHAAD